MGWSTRWYRTFHSGASLLGHAARIDYAVVCCPKSATHLPQGLDQNQTACVGAISTTALLLVSVLLVVLADSKQRVVRSCRPVAPAFLPAACFPGRRVQAGVAGGVN